MKQTIVQNGAWKPYEPSPNSLWHNPDMLICTFPTCGFADVDWETITSHYISEHGRLNTQEPSPDDEPSQNSAQGKLTGGKLSKEDRIAEILLALPKERLRCVYCFASQDSKAVRQFNEDGKLLKTAKCVECGKMMELDTMRVMRDPKRFGKFIGEYKGWWFKVDHDKWVSGLKSVYSQKAAMGLFWQGYAEGNPKFAERKRIEAAGGNVELAKARQQVEDSKEIKDEMAKYRRADGSIDWDKMAEDAAAHLQGRLE